MLNYLIESPIQFCSILLDRDCEYRRIVVVTGSQEANWMNMYIALFSRGMPPCGALAKAKHLRKSQVRK
jgi:hypothetical protein